MKRGWIGALGAAVALLASFGSAPDAVAQETRAERPLSVSVVGGTGGYLGVSIADVDDEMAGEAGLSGEYGVYVTNVVEDGPAADAGLEDGDVLVSWNGERLYSVVQLQRLTRETPAGREVRLGVVRDGSEREVTVELGDRSRARPGLNVFTVPRERIVISPERQEEIRERQQQRASELRDRIRDRIAVVPREGVNVRTFFGRPRLGVSIQSLGEQLADYFGVDGGALVTDVSEDSPAEAAGIRAGDVIVAIRGESVEDPGELMEILSDLDAGPVDVTVVRDGARRTLTVELEEREAGWDDGEGGVFYFEDGEGRFRFDGFEGGDFRFEPMMFEGFEFGPMNFDFDDFGPFDWQFDFEGEADAFEVSIPRIEIPAFEVPAIEIPEIRVPAFDVGAPGIVIVT